MALPQQAQSQPHTPKSTPYLRRTKNSAQLVVNGKPFLMLAGELHNSSLSSAKYMSTVWPALKHMNLNTVLGAVPWDMIEPVEGTFAFDELDKCIYGAREHGLHLVLLWFGSYKNARSSYVPGWVKRDVKRFPRVHVLDEDRRIETIEQVSPFCEEVWQADGRAFAALMKHLKDVDQEHSTVVLVQVENETGMLGDSRDRSMVAEKRYREPVPANLMEYLGKQKHMHPTFEKRWPGFSESLGSCKNTCWEDVFGIGVATEELFMADAFSRYVSKVAAAGRKEYHIPMYTNCWLNVDDPSVLDLTGVTPGEGVPIIAGGGAKPGFYPSGGPVPHALDIWNCHTIDQGVLDFIAPDLYLHDYDWISQQYRYKDNPLFIPEQKVDRAGIRRTWLAYGTYGCLGCGPFGIDDIYMDEAEINGWRRTYGLLGSFSQTILDVQAERPHDMFGFFFDEIDDTQSRQKEKWSRKFPAIDMEVTIERAFVFGKAAPGHGIVIHQGNNKFLLIGEGFQTTFKSTKAETTFTGLVSVAEKEVDENGRLSTLRAMGGDETKSGAAVVMPSEQPDLGSFPIRITIPARTYIAEVEVYTLQEERGDY